MTKKHLKDLIKEVLDEVEKLTPEEAAYSSNVVIKQLYTALKANPIYKGVRVSYLTNRSDGGGASTFGYIGNAGDGNPYVFISTSADGPIRVKISDGSVRNTTEEFTNVNDAIKFIKNPLAALKKSYNPPGLKGATVIQVMEKNGEVYIRLKAANSGTLFDAKLV